MAELTEQQFLEKLDADGKAFFQSVLTKNGEAAVTKFKTESEEARKKAIPEKYELKFNDGTVLDPNADADEIAKYARENGLTNDQAQKLADQMAARAKAVIDRREQKVKTEREAWAA